MLKKIIPLLLVACVVLLVASLAAGCTSKESTASMELVPQRATTVGKINLSRILGDEDLIGLYDRLPRESSETQTFDDAMAQYMEETGIDLRDFDEILYFADALSGTGDTGYSDGAGEPDYTGGIVKGAFQEGVLLAAIEESGEVELNLVDYKGYEIYTDRNGEGAIAFLSDGVFVSGTMELVEDIIDVKEGDEPALSGELVDRYNELGDPLFKVAQLMPPGLAEEWVPEEPGGFPSQSLDLSALLGGVESGASILDKVGQSISFETRSCYLSGESAEAVEALLNLYLTWYPLIISGGSPWEMPALLEDILWGTPTPMEGLELLDKIEVDTTGSCLNIKFVITISEIEEFIETLESMEAFDLDGGDTF